MPQIQDVVIEPIDPTGSTLYSVIGTVKTRIATHDGEKVVPVPNARVEILEYDPPNPSGSMVPVFPFQPAPSRITPEDRRPLGAVYTDRDGNFEYSFYWIPTLTAGGAFDPQLVYDGVPDVVARVSQSLDGRTVELAETEPYMNIGTRQLLGDVFVPAERLLLLPNTSLGDAGPKGFQAIGLLPSDRLQDGYANSRPGDLVALQNAPFGGVLELYAHFGDADVTHYRLRWAPHGTTDFEDVDDGLRNYVYDHQRKTWKGVSLGPAEVGGVANLYRSIEEAQESYLFHAKLKARWSTYDLLPGKYVVRIEGYRLDPASGKAQPVAGAIHEISALRIDNVRPTAEILGLYKEGASTAESECGIIDLTSDPTQKLRVKVKVRDPEGHLGSWSLSTHHGRGRDAGEKFRYGDRQDDKASWHGPGETEVALPVAISGTVKPKWQRCAYGFGLYAVGRSTDGRSSRLLSQETRARVNTYIDA